MAEAPQNIPTAPPMRVIAVTPVKSPADGRKNKAVRLRNTTCSPLFSFRVATNISSVNTPQISRYQPMLLRSAGTMPGKGLIQIRISDHQKKP